MILFDVALWSHVVWDSTLHRQITSYIVNNLICCQLYRVAKPWVWKNVHGWLVRELNPNPPSIEPVSIAAPGTPAEADQSGERSRLIARECSLIP